MDVIKYYYETVVPIGLLSKFIVRDFDGENPFHRSVLVQDITGVFTEIRVSSANDLKNKVLSMAPLSVISKPCIIF